MKKILLIIISIMILPILVKADMGAPAIIEYKASISKPEGAKYYSHEYENNSYKLIEKGALNFGEEIEISYEESVDGIKYGQFNNNFFVKIDDITILNNTFDLNSEKIHKILPDDHYEQKGVVLSNDGLKMYNGPAYGYKENGTTIPTGTNVSFTHVLDDMGESPWYFTEYDGVKGWICVLNGTVGFAPNYDEYITSYDEIITDIITDGPLSYNKDFNKLETIEANTIIKSNKLYGLDAWSRGNNYITYNNVSGYISNYNLIPKCESKCNIIIKDNYNELYDKFDLHEVGTLESNNKVKSKKIATIPTNTEVTLLYVGGGDYDENFIGYIEYEGTKGWIEIPQDYYYGLNENKNELVTTTTITPTTTSILKDNKDKQYNREDLILICIIAAVIVSVTAIVIVLLVNKKKKNVIEGDNK